MKITSALFALCALPAIAAAGVGRGEAERKNEACEQAKAKAQATCPSGQAASLASCQCVERNTTIYLKNWRCAVEATCAPAKAGTPTDGNAPPVPSSP
jgi:hypothetical protein